MIGPVSFTLLASALLCGILSSYAWSRRRISPAVRYAALFFGAATLYVGGYALELASADLPEILFWVRVEYLGIAVAPALVIAMALAYTGRDRLLTPPALAALLVVPAITLALVLTLDPLYYAAVALDVSGPHPRFAFVPGPWYYAAAAYSLGALIAAVVLVAQSMRSAHPPFRRQAAVVLAGAAVPLVAYACYLAGLVPVPGIDPVPLAIPVTAIAFTIGIARFRLFDLAPVARSAVFERIPVGVLVFDARGSVVEANPAAASLLGSGGGSLVGRTADELARLLPRLPELLAPGGGAEVEVGDPAGARTLAVSAAPLQAGDHGETVVLISDITARRRAEGALARRTADLEAANRRLSLVSTFTRHDLANHLVAIEGYLALVREDTDDPAVPELLDRLAGAVGRLRKLSAFVRDYPAIGTQPPVWLDLRPTADHAAAAAGVDAEIVIENRLPSVSVLADPLLERVFAALIENAVRHGGGATRVLLASVPADEGLLLVVEDDGAGIPWSDKERVFERGFGRNTGLGLFLAREILGSMGMAIAETGVPGHGARFEIRVPASRTRYVSGGTAEGAGPALARHP
jgi:PAS domain S-box-containing protein